MLRETNNQMRVLEPPSGQRIIGFYGRSCWQDNFDGLAEFGIVTAPKDLELPDAVYSMKELQNTDGGEDINAAENESDVDDDEEMD